MPKITNLPTPPEAFICPITQEIMAEPVATADGQVYEKDAIHRWLVTNNKSPITNLPLANKNLIPIPLIKSQIQDFLQKNKICTEQEFMAAVETGHVDQVEQLNYLDKHLHYSNVIFDEYDRHDEGTALFNAVSAGHVEMVNYLLKNGGNPNDSLCSTGWTVLQEAISKNCITNYRVDFSNLPSIEVMLKNARFEENQNTKHKQSLKENAEPEKRISKKHIEITKILLEQGADPNQRDYGEQEEPPLFMATKNNLMEVVSHLIHAKADTEIFDLFSGFTILHIAVANDCKNMVNLIVQQAPQLMDFRDDNGDTPLHIAAKNDQKEIATILLTEGADYKALNNAKKTPVAVAKETGKDAMAETILHIHQSLKRLMIKNAVNSIALETQLQAQQMEINQLKAQLQKILAHLDSSDSKSSNDYSPKLFK